MIQKKRGLFLLVLSFFLIVVSLPAATAIAGCYIFSNADDSLYCQSLDDQEAQADCNANTECDMTQHFLVGSDCSDVPECELVTCNVDCQEYPLGKCQQLGIEQGGPPGQAVSDAEYNLWCTEGCCTFPQPVTGNTFCEFRLTNYLCTLRAQQSGVTNPTFVRGVSAQECFNTVCNADVELGSVQGFIVSSDQVPIGGATILLEGRSQQAASGTDGSYYLSSLAAGTYQVRITAEGYLPISATFSVNPGEAVSRNFTLQAIAGTAEVSGIVYDVSGIPLSGVTISWSGVIAGRIETDRDGRYRITGIPAGEYTFKASKINFLQQQLTRTFQVGDAVQNFDFTLQQAQFQGIQGIIYLDSNNDRRFDANADQPLPAGSLYVDGRFRGFSKHPDGNFMIRVAEAGPHTIKAIYSTYTSEELNVQVPEGSAPESLILLLTAYQGECSDLGTEKDVAVFTAHHVPGQKVVRLQWSKPCVDVRGYELQRIKGGVVEETFTLPRSQHILVDDDVEWGLTYTYHITALYGQDRRSPTAVAHTITVGDPRCEEKYHEDTGWESFCLIDDRRLVYTCNEQNQLLTQDCAALDAAESIHFCAPTSSRTADCKDAGICSQQDAQPFGLYHTRNACYGTENPEAGNSINYCYFDATSSIVNTCESCTAVENCFDYQSQDACEVNSCLGTKCRWVDGAGNGDPSSPLVDYSVLFSGLQIPETVTRETGSGYCVEEDYALDDTCSLCGASASIFENYYCTAQVCASLGRCFSNPLSEGPALSYCQSCGPAPTRNNNCYAYTTELECTDGQSIRNENGLFQLSGDQCGWGRCSWDNTGGAGSCFKDGDADDQDDCALASFTAAQREACRIDNTPPRTTVVAEGLPTISRSTPVLQFTGDDDFHEQQQQRNRLQLFSYCLHSAEAPESCTPNDFVSILYTGRTNQETIDVDILTSDFLKDKDIKGETYRVKFYSKDIFSNQENVQQATLFIDTVAPQFTIGNTTQTTADSTEFTAFLEGVNEPMSCSFALTPILPLGTQQVVQVGREKTQKSVTFTNLPGVLYDLNVTCQDDYGNSNSKLKRFTFDLEEDIEIINPPFYGAVKEREIAFEINTKIGASCELFTTSDNQRVALFDILTEDGKSHRTPPIPGFIEREYSGEYKVVCTELLSNELFEDYFHFQVDFTPPVTQIILKEGSREVQPTVYGWEEYFIQGVDVDFICREEGFACDKTFYCLGKDCETLRGQNFKEYTAALTLNKTTEICYYSTDVANNRVYNPQCGAVFVEGYGIRLENPLLHFFNKEQWGVSHLPIYDVEFSTRVPTSECRFDFNPGFIYEEVPQHKIRTPIENGKYRIANFPESFFSEFPTRGGVKELYIRCKTAENEIGPAQKINLEYDPSVPKIKKAVAEPELVVEQVNTKLIVETDDKTLCRYSDNSAGQGSDEYATMDYKFPDELDRVLRQSHEDTFKINFIGAAKEYKLNVQCKNGAGNFSSIEELEFTVDYATVGNILAVSPQGEYFREQVIPFSVQTSHNAICEYKHNESYVPFSGGANTRQHSASYQALEEKDYQIPVRCRMGDRTAEAEIKFTIDKTAPVITRADDGNYTCGSEHIAVYVNHPNESSIAAYKYELYEIGEEQDKLDAAYIGKSTVNTTTSTSRFGLSQSSRRFSSIQTTSLPRGILVTTETVDFSQPIKIPTISLKQNYTYRVRVLAQDSAGNVGQFTESDGVVIISKNATICRETKTSPEIDFSINDNACTFVSVGISCRDSIGCNEITYGQHSSSSLCNATKAYGGAPITLQKTAFICYTVENHVGNNFRGVKKITFPDEDGDGVSDSCDVCPGTSNGDAVDTVGCAKDEAAEGTQQEDTDTDGLPDYWERIYNTAACPFDETLTDSDFNGISDNDEDYDNDEATNFQEFLARTDPCLAEETPRADREESEDGFDFPDSPISSEESDLLAWILLVIGVLLTVGGSGYLIYYYQQNKTPGKSNLRQPTPSRVIPAKPVQSIGFVDSWKQKIANLQRERAAKAREKQRSAVFSSFSKDSKAIPHVEKVLQKKGEHLPRLHELAHAYNEHKEEIKPGLRQEEKGIFGKLEGIAKQTKKKDITEVVSKQEAKDIFSKLKEISKKRKEK